MAQFLSYRNQEKRRYLKVFEYDMNVSMFIVGVALWVYAGVRERCRVVALLASFTFFPPLFFLLFFTFFSFFFFVPIPSP